MKNILWLIPFVVSSTFLFACQDSSKKVCDIYNTVLVEGKKITLPVDENMYYFSRSIFQYEKDGKEFLHFENTEKMQYEIINYDLETQKISKRIRLHKQGPNATPSVMGSRPLGDSAFIALFQNNISRITLLNGEGEIVSNFPIKSSSSYFIPFLPGSDFYTPGFMKDSILYLAPLVSKPNMRKEDWRKTSLFFGLDLRTGYVDFLPIYYPLVFNENVKNLAMGAEFSYDYNYRKNRLVCSFIGYDSLMVIDDLCSVKWYDGKSRYIKSLKPKLFEAGQGMQSLIERKEQPHYYHMMYDKYRDVYYRFVEHPCEISDDESVMDYVKSREFSVIILDNKFRIIGETKFPGNRFFYMMSFVGRDGLYISENNLANSDFDENKLVFTCFNLVNNIEK